MTITIKYGGCAKDDAGAMPKTRLIGLWWEAKAVATLADLDGIQQKPGVYAIEGCHDAHRARCVLYVGMTARVAGERACDSMRSKCFWNDGSGKSGLYSAAWDLSLRWAPVDDPDVEIGEIETLLIRAHAPAWNNQNVIGFLGEDYSDLLIVNGGEKGLLLPAVAGIYFVRSAWP